MNIIQADILKFLSKSFNHTQKQIAEKTNYSVGAVNKAIRELREEGLINQQNEPSEKALELLRENKPKNAIILAAGFGIRMVPINLERPKALLRVNDERLIERLIDQLHEVGVEDITVVAGFQKERLDYLVDKYHVNMEYTDTYHDHNNLHSLYKVRNRIGNTYILPSDLYFYDNPFSDEELYSWYMISDKESKGSYIRQTRSQEIAHIGPDKISNKMIGVSYITANDKKEVIELLEKHAKSEEFDNYFWEDALIKGGFKFYSKMIKDDRYIEINTYEKLREVDSGSRHLESKAMKIISDVFNVENEEIVNIRTLKKGMTNRSFLFSIGDKKYIMRIPGEGTDKMINRRQEAEVYDVIKDEKISDDILYINPETGHKITKYIPNSRNLDMEDKEEVKRALLYLKDFHNKKLKANHVFDPFERIEYYESLWIQEDSLYPDYKQTKENVFKIKKFIEENEQEYVLSHIDSVAVNFLFHKDKEEDEYKITLIDWEYSGMQDPRIDIAMFCIYALLERDEIDEIIDIYFEDKASETDRNMVYAYIASCGLTWSNWCEIKSQLGVEYGEYSIKQYRYAKDYYKILNEKGLVE